jgi:hypothetical protein
MNKGEVASGILAPYLVKASLLGEIAFSDQVIT